MGRGESKSITGGLLSSESIISPDGETIDLSESPLKYGGLDKALTGEARKNIEEFENNRYNEDVEFAMLVMSDGTNVGGEFMGGKESVSTPTWANQKATGVFSHNHPRPEGIIGGTFSPEDLENFSECPRKTNRAAAKEGTYSISKGKKYNPNGLLEAYKPYVENKIKETNKAVDKLTSDYANNRITRRQLIKQYRAVTNKMLVDLHNFLLKNQRKYGYTYTLERRRK